MSQEVKPPFSVVASITLGLTCLAISCGVSIPLGVSWAPALLALSVTVLLSIAWPCSIMAMRGKILDDRSMSMGEVVFDSKGAMPLPLLKGVYTACVALAYASLAMALIDIGTYPLKSITPEFGQAVSNSSADRSIDKRGMGGLMLMVTISGALCCTGLSAVLWIKTRRLAYMSLACAVVFALLATWFAGCAAGIAAVKCVAVYQCTK